MHRELTFKINKLTYHLHGGKDSNRVTLLHLVAVLGTDLDNNTRHRSADL